MGESGAMKPSVSSKKDTLAPFVVLMTAYLSLNSVLNLSNKYALVSLLAGGFLCFVAPRDAGTRALVGERRRNSTGEKAGKERKISAFE